MRKGITEEVEDQACLWREGLEEAIRERVRQVIEAVLQEEVEEVLGARRGTAARTTDGHAGADLHGDGDRNLGRRGPQHHADPEGQLARGCRPAWEPVVAWVARPEGRDFSR